MQKIQAIETVYNGYRFRSRLEARWAVFFDSAEIDYDYEPEGVDLCGEYYLPDFFLPDFKIYVEIKPFDKNIVSHVGDRNVWEKKCSLFRDVTEMPILLCYGDPTCDLIKLLFAWDCGDSNAGSSEWVCNFVEDVINRRIILATEPSSHDLFLDPMMSVTNEYIIQADTFDDVLVRYDPLRKDPLNIAKTNARQARFEHGEMPRIGGYKS